MKKLLIGLAVGMIVGYALSESKQVRQLVEKGKNKLKTAQK
jgi:hypothetical protein